MGLDMYLNKKTYIWSWDRKKVKIIKVKGIKSSRVKEIVEELGYWRKANAIHKWFVDNVQEGKDDCKEYYVEEEKLEELLSLVVKVLKKHSLAKTLLPTQEGFYFGDTLYNEFYFEDLKESKKILKEALKEIKKGGDIYYSSSW